MKYLLLLANSSIYEYVQKDAYHRLITYKQYINQKKINIQLFIKVYNGIINFKFLNKEKLITHN